MAGAPKQRIRKYRDTPNAIIPRNEPAITAGAPKQRVHKYCDIPSTTIARNGAVITASAPKQRVHRYLRTPKNTTPRESLLVGDSKQSAEYPDQRALLKLPQNLQDTIFDMAYGRGGEQKRIEDQMHLQCNWPGDLQDKFSVNKIFVSKAFFLGAAKAYMRSGPIQIITSGIKMGVVNAFAQDIFVTDTVFYQDWKSDSFPALKNLKINIYPWTGKFRCSLPKTAMTDTEIKESALFKKVTTLVRGLERFEADACPIGGTARAQSVPSMATNAKRFEQLAMPFVMAPDTGDSLRIPLYLGSNVSALRARAGATIPDEA